jgi:uncharacterized membrane protein YphA (DoxX/SURF4 family)
VFVACAVVSVVLGVMMVMSAAMKLIKHPRVVDGIGTALGVPITWFPRLAAAEIAGGIGLVVGLAIPAVGVAAAIGLIAYFVGAIIAHLRAGDTKGIVQPMMPLLLSVAALVLRLATL